MADNKVNEIVDNSKQLGSTSQWNKTPRQLRNEYDPNKKGQWGGQAIHASAVELTQKLPSRSAFRTSDDPVDTLAGFEMNTDARVHELWNILLALLVEYKPAVDTLKTAAAKGDSLAQAVLDKINSK